MRHRPPLRTYSHLEDHDRVPSEYDLVSSRLLYYVERGFEVAVPVGPWYQRHQRGSGLQGIDWERFADPRETTYTSYTRLAAQHEAHLEALSRSVEATGHDDRLPAAFVAHAGEVIAPLRYVWHGFQMIAAYFGQMAPSGRVTLVALFQAGDEMRRIHRVAARMGQLRQRHPEHGAQARELWQEHAAYQPLRRAVEEALCAYDWGEAVTALCLTVKPCIDELVLRQWAGKARAQDFFLGEILDSFALDAAWHRAWAAAFVRHALASNPDSGEVLRGWLARWWPAACAATLGLAPLLDDEAAGRRALDQVAAWLTGLGLAPP